MVMNEMKLDMSMPDHRKVLKKYEKVFVGVLTPEGDVVNFADESQRNPENQLKFQVQFLLYLVLWEAISSSYHHARELIIFLTDLEIVSLSPWFNDQIYFQNTI